MNRLFIKILKFVVNAAWYIFIPLMGIVSVVIAVKIWQMGYLIWDIPVYIKQVNNLPAIQSSGASFQYLGLNNAAAVLKVKVKLTPLLVANVVIFFSASMFLLFGILHQLRKILNSLKANTPFAFENVRRLRLISLFVFMMTVLQFIDSVRNYFLLPPDFPGLADVYRIQIYWGFQPIIISIVVFVLSEIFRQGYHLKTDNESFV
ncbi:Protein of unknown function (DUF2975) [Chitinophaga niastensis]|uniref:DUF2975 family protein n=1 Tax=Chitinophaga niastensis TaxID=536980 RepID=A0A2P8HP14_CHINA|nr:DUF2975 domain-containing protein [Chitinophaga niastensis]PSL47917.1 Protein of unknown function (DUF2975) [Chitinophaga niastensis]